MVRLIGARKVPTIADGGGVWTLSDVAKFRKDGIWPENDPYFSYVGLLLPMTGENNSTTFTDYSLTPKTITRYGDAKISTNQSKWGMGSGYFDGTGDYLETNCGDWAAFGTGDFTVEFWYNTSNSGANNLIYDSRPVSTNGAYLMIGRNPSNKIFIYVNTGDRIVGNVTISSGSWYHIAVSRSSGSTKLFINGNQDGSTFSDNTNYLNTSNRPTVGAAGFGAVEYINGYMQDLRITKGFARYTANFTQPTIRFPLSG